jgi:hypothetical protein
LQVLASGVGGHATNGRGVAYAVAAARTRLASSGLAFASTVSSA